MLVTIADLEGLPFEAKIELEPDTIILHSRGGAFGKPNLRNPDYRKALRVMLHRLKASGLQPSGVWLDSPQLLIPSAMNIARACPPR